MEVFFVKTNKVHIKRGIFYLAISLCVGFLLFTVLICICAIILSKVDLPLSILPPLTLGIISVCTCVCAYIFAYLIKKNGLILGVTFAALIYLCILLVSTIQGFDVFTQLSAIKAFTLITSGAFGGYFGALKCNQKRKIKRK